MVRNDTVNEPNQGHQNCQTVFCQLRNSGRVTPCCKNHLLLPNDDGVPLTMSIITVELVARLLVTDVQRYRRYLRIKEMKWNRRGNAIHIVRDASRRTSARIPSWSVVYVIEYDGCVRTRIQYIFISFFGK